MPILSLGQKDPDSGGQDDRSSGLIGSLLSSVPEYLRESGTFSFKGRVGRKGYWILLLWTNLAPMIACIPFIIWASTTCDSPAYWRFAVAVLRMSGWEAFGIFGLLVAGGLYYWMLSATLAKRFHDLGLPAWLALIFVTEVWMTAPVDTISHVRGWEIPIFLSRYFFPILLTAQGAFSVPEGLFFYVSPLFFFILLIGLGLVKKTPEPNKTTRKIFIAAVAVLLLIGLIRFALGVWEFTGIFVH